MSENNSSHSMIEVSGLTKSFGGVAALDGRFGPLGGLALGVGLTVAGLILVNQLLPARR